MRLGSNIFMLAERPDLEARSRWLLSTFPEFMHHDAVVDRYWYALFADFAGVQIAVCDDGSGVLAAGHCIPVFWDGTIGDLPEGLDGVLERGAEGIRRGRAPTVVSALLAVVPPVHRGRGLSSVVLDAMKAVAAKHGLEALIAPVRPTLKERYPLTPMERYGRWERDDGLPFDPGSWSTAGSARSFSGLRPSRWSSRELFRSGRDGRICIFPRPALT